MCISVPGQVVSRTGDKGVVDVLGNQVHVAFDLLPDAKVGDYVLLHAGFALQLVNESAARASLQLVRSGGNDPPAGRSRR